MCLSYLTATPVTESCIGHIDTPTPPTHHVCAATDWSHHCGGGERGRSACRRKGCGHVRLQWLLTGPAVSAVHTVPCATNQADNFTLQQSDKPHKSSRQLPGNNVASKQITLPCNNVSGPTSQADNFTLQPCGKQADNFILQQSGKPHQSSKQLYPATAADQTMPVYQQLDWGPGLCAHTRLHH